MGGDRSMVSERVCVYRRHAIVLMRFHSLIHPFAYIPCPKSLSTLRELFRIWALRSSEAYRFLYNQDRLLPSSSPKMMEWKVGRDYQVDAHISQVSDATAT